MFYYSSILVLVVLEVFTYYEADFEVSVFLIKNFIGSRFKILWNWQCFCSKYGSRLSSTTFLLITWFTVPGMDPVYPIQWFVNESAITPQTVRRSPQSPAYNKTEIILPKSLMPQIVTVFTFCFLLSFNFCLHTFVNNHFYNSKFE